MAGDIMLRHLLHPSPRPRRGFTLVEILIAAAVMMLSTIGSAVLFNMATRQGLSSDLRLQEQLAISRDLATILDLNERYNCDLSGCGIAPDLESPPDQDDYAPADADAILPGVLPAGSSFRSLCESGLLSNLISALQSTGDIHPEARPGEIRLAGTAVRRTVSRLDLNEAQQSLPPHRYRVDWRDGDGRLLRQVQLIPTIAAWCP